MKTENLKEYETILLKTERLKEYDTIIIHQHSTFNLLGTNSWNADAVVKHPGWRKKTCKDKTKKSKMIDNQNKSQDKTCRRLLHLWHPSCRHTPFHNAISSKFV